MSILKISRLGHPILVAKSKLVEDISAPQTKQIVQDMTQTMLDAQGIGLAAPQVHISKQIMIFRIPEEDEDDSIKISVLINPKLSKISDETDNEWEGCLSIPGMMGLVKRFSKIKYEGYDLLGNIIKREVSGLHARVVQHEFDHLMGILYISRLVNKNAFGYSEEVEAYLKKNRKQ